MTGVNHWISTVLMFTGGFIAGTSASFEATGWQLGGFVSCLLVFMIKLFYEFILMGRDNDDNES